MGRSSRRSLISASLNIEMIALWWVSLLNSHSVIACREQTNELQIVSMLSEKHHLNSNLRTVNYSSPIPNFLSLYWLRSSPKIAQRRVATGNLGRSTIIGSTALRLGCTASIQRRYSNALDVPRHGSTVQSLKVNSNLVRLWRSEVKNRFYLFSLQFSTS